MGQNNHTDGKCLHGVGGSEPTDGKSRSKIGTALCMSVASATITKRGSEKDPATINNSIDTTCLLSNLTIVNPRSALRDI